MVLIVQVLMLFIVINTVLKLSFWRWGQIVSLAALYAIFVVATCKYAVLQSKTQLADYLTNRDVMQNAAVLITMESVICLTFCFVALKAMHSTKRKFWTRVLDYYPGLLMFPVLFYMLTQSIYAMPGSDFTAISYLLAIGVLVIIPLLSYAIKYLCPEKELRLEVYFLVSLFVCIIGLITTVNGNVTYIATQTSPNIYAIAISIALFIIMFLLGVMCNRLKWTIIYRKISKLK